MSFSWPISRDSAPKFGFYDDDTEALLKSDGEEYSRPYSNIQEKFKYSNGFPSVKRLETFKAMMQKFGLIYVDNSVLHLTDLGSNVYSQVTEHNKKLAKVFSNVLSRYQFNNPNKDVRHKIPNDCNILPYFTTWKIMRQCSNKLHVQEFLRCLTTIKYSTQIEEVILKIRTARLQEGYKELLESGDARLERVLGPIVAGGQPTTDASYWLALAGAGGLIIEPYNRKDGFRYLTDFSISCIDEIIANAPSYIDFGEDREAWRKYWLRSADEDIREDSVVDKVYLDRKVTVFNDRGDLDLSQKEEGDLIILSDHPEFIQVISSQDGVKVLSPYKKIRKQIEDL